MHILPIRSGAGFKYNYSQAAMPLNLMMACLLWWTYSACLMDVVNSPKGFSPIITAFCSHVPHYLPADQTVPLHGADSSVLQVCAESFHRLRSYWAILHAIHANYVYACRYNNVLREAMLSRRRPTQTLSLNMRRSFVSGLCLAENYSCSTAHPLIPG